MPGFVRGANLLPPRLRNLAANATQRATWPQLRAYARSQTDPEWSGWASFLAGYEEYDADEFPEAAQDFAHAAKSGFSSRITRPITKAKLSADPTIPRRPRRRWRISPRVFPVAPCACGRSRCA